MTTPYPWQDEAWRRLQRLRARPPQALLLHGARGIGKLALARAFAHSLLCEQPDAGGFACGQCPPCIWLREEGASPDLRVLEPLEDDVEEGDGARDKKEKGRTPPITVAQVRDLADFVQLTAHRNGRHVVLVHPAEALNAQAANALLKTLEEPPAQTLFVLVSHQPRRLLPTVLSRCQKMPVERPDPAAALTWLNAQGVADAELCLALAAGAPLEALRHADPEQVAQRRTLLAVLQRPDGDLLAAAEQWQRLPMAEILDTLQTWCHDLASLRLTGRARYNVDADAAQRRLAAAADLGALLALEGELRAARRAVQHTLNARLVLDGLLLSYRQAVCA